MSTTTIGLVLIIVAAWVVITVPLLIREERRQQRQDRTMAQMQAEVRQSRAVLDYLHTALAEQPASPNTRPQLALAQAPELPGEGEAGEPASVSGSNARRRLVAAVALLVAALFLAGLGSYCTVQDTSVETLIEDVEESFTTGLE